MKIKIKDEDELISVAEDLIYVLVNLRKFTKLWEGTYGVDLKRQKKYYEQQADELIERLKVQNHKSREQVNIKLDAH
jgi:hypothetical protein